MIRIKSIIFRYAPYFVQDLAVSVYNSWLIKRRHSGDYQKWRAYFQRMEGASQLELKAEASRLLAEFLEYVVARSPWYSEHGGKDLAQFPVLSKTDIVDNLPEIATVHPPEARVGFTGGTTGVSMKVHALPGDVQARHALLDHFRAGYGYTLGEKVAWFSGKELATQRDVDRGRCYRDDLVNNIRFFSTFHINERNFDAYWSALERFKPLYMVGFPSSIYDIAVMAKARNLKSTYDVKVVFSTAETLLPLHREVIGSVFSARLVDQYASSEGAPFILECAEGGLHFHPLSGVIEVIDSDGRAAMEGEMLVTSFTTRGTPLVRYRIGDRVSMAPAGEACRCGSSFPLVKSIDGRSSDFIWSAQNGRVNSVNLSNSTKGVKGIQRFQAVQRDRGEIDLLVMATQDFDVDQERAFIAAIRLRVGDEIKIRLRRVPEIPREKSGKHRVVKNYVDFLRNSESK